MGKAKNNGLNLCARCERALKWIFFDRVGKSGATVLYAQNFFQKQRQSSQGQRASKCVLRKKLQDSRCWAAARHQGQKAQGEVIA